ncbi:MAG: ATP-binding cassette domain-containing protein, partial [Armatimonadetes bacterium]|nr:ATP-binding cassette domain-containing protein [Armatimonadota bacterium]
MSSSPPILRAEGLHVRFGGVEALGGVSCDVQAGEFFGIIGPNGAGKTTLLRVLHGVVRFAAGTV